MFRFLPILTLLLVTVGLNSCVPPGARTAQKDLPPGQVYRGEILDITSPESSGWRLMQSSSQGWIFFRRGESYGESFVAGVLLFTPPQTDSPKEFEDQIIQMVLSDPETERFSNKQITHQFDGKRGYPCVRVHNVTEDSQAKTGSGGTATLLLENVHLYCRHPIRKEIGFMITYSHRGENLHPDMQSEAQSFIDGIQVPENASSP